jgi:uncharacterized protein (DUF58 family)
MTRRGRLALGLGGLTYVAAWAFGSRPLFVVAVGLLLAVLLAWLSVRSTARPVALRRKLKAEAYERDDLKVRVELELESGLVPAGITLVERYAKLGERRTSLQRAGRHLWSLYVLWDVPRGRYAIESAEVVVEDVFGLERVVTPLEKQPALVVYPRLVELDRLFTEAGAHGREGRRLLLQRPTGFDVHSVRDYVEGDSLRRVHWRSTARRARLMVKELEDSPRDELAVVLDAWRGCPREPFDVAVRAAGSLLQSYARRGRRAALVVGGSTQQVQRVHAEGDWRRALELLAAVEPDGDAPPERLLSGDRNPAALAFDLVVVTVRLDPGLVDRLAQRAAAHRSTAVVYVDASRRPEPALLRLQAAGIPVAVARVGDDLRRVLAIPRVFEEAVRV